jgi:hypothetical protein
VGYGLVGFDAGSFAALAATGWPAWRHTCGRGEHDRHRDALVVGAWCDLVTAPGGALAVAIVEAVLVELPLAALSPYIAPHARWSLPRGLTTARAGV